MIELPDGNLVVSQLGGSRKIRHITVPVPGRVQSDVTEPLVGRRCGDQADLPWVYVHRIRDDRSRPRIPVCDLQRKRRATVFAGSETLDGANDGQGTAARVHCHLIALLTLAVHESPRHCLAPAAQRLHRGGRYRHGQDSQGYFGAPQHRPRNRHITSVGQGGAVTSITVGATLPNVGDIGVDAQGNYVVSGYSSDILGIDYQVSLHGTQTQELTDRRLSLSLPSPRGLVSSGAKTASTLTSPLLTYTG